MFRKTIVMLIVFAILATVFAACGGGGAGATTGGGDKINLVYWAQLSEGWNVSHRAIVEKFNASQNEIVVTTEFFPYDDFEQKIQTSLMQKGGGADIYELWGGWAPDFVHTGALSKVPDSFASSFSSDYYPSTVGSFEYEGSYYGVPIEYNIESGGLLVNKALFDEHSISYPTTWDEMISTAEKYSVSDGVITDMHGFAFTTEDNVMYTLMAMMLSKGGNYYGVDGKFHFASPEGVDAMTQLVSYIVDKKLTNLDELTGGGDMEASNVLFEGRALMVPRGPWVLSEAAEQYDLEVGKDIDYIEMPWYGSKKAFAAETGWGLAVPEGSANEEAAWKFVEFMMQEENLVDHIIACGMLPPRKSMHNNAKYVEAMPHMAPLMGILEYGQYLGYFNTQVLKDEINNMFVALCTTDDYPSVEEALKALDETLNEELLG